MGQITSDVAGLGCPPLCTTKVAAGTTITLAASPASSSRFVGWSGSACAGTSGCTFTVTDNVQIGAAFNIVRPLNLSIGGNGGGRVQSGGGEVDCVDDCVVQLDDAASVTLTATPDATSRLGSWSQACTGTSGASCGVSATAPVGVGIEFIATRAVTLEPTGSGTGTVTSS